MLTNGRPVGQSGLATSAPEACFRRAILGVELLPEALPQLWKTYIPGIKRKVPSSGAYGGCVRVPGGHEAETRPPSLPLGSRTPQHTPRWSLGPRSFVGGAAGSPRPRLPRPNRRVRSWLCCEVRAHPAFTGDAGRGCDLSREKGQGEASPMIRDPRDPVCTLAPAPPTLTRRRKETCSPG